LAYLTSSFPHLDVNKKDICDNSPLSISLIYHHQTSIPSPISSSSSSSLTKLSIYELVEFWLGSGCEISSPVSILKLCKNFNLFVLIESYLTPRDDPKYDLLLTYFIKNNNFKNKEIRFVFMND